MNIIVVFLLIVLAILIAMLIRQYDSKVGGVLGGFMLGAGFFSSEAKWDNEIYPQTAPVTPANPAITTSPFQVRRTCIFSRVKQTKNKSYKYCTSGFVVMKGSNLSNVDPRTGKPTVAPISIKEVPNIPMIIDNQSQLPPTGLYSAVLVTNNSIINAEFRQNRPIMVVDGQGNQFAQTDTRVYNAYVDVNDIGEKGPVYWGINPNIMKNKVQLIPQTDANGFVLYIDKIIYFGASGLASTTALKQNAIGAVPIGLARDVLGPNRVLDKVSNTIGITPQSNQQAIQLQQQTANYYAAQAQAQAQYQAQAQAQYQAQAHAQAQAQAQSQAQYNQNRIKMEQEHMERLRQAEAENKAKMAAMQAAAPPMMQTPPSIPNPDLSNYGTATFKTVPVVKPIDVALNPAPTVYSNIPSAIPSTLSKPVAPPPLPRDDTFRKESPVVVRNPGAESDYQQIPIF